MRRLSKGRINRTGCSATSPPGATGLALPIARNKASTAGDEAATDRAISQACCSSCARIETRDFELSDDARSIRT